MKVLVMFEATDELTRLMFIDMTAEEYHELRPAHGHLSGCYGGEVNDPVNQALCKWYFATISSDTYKLDGNDKEWMEEANVSESWLNRFQSRITMLESTHTATSFDAFIKTGTEY